MSSRKQQRDNEIHDKIVAAFNDVLRQVGWGTMNPRFRYWRQNSRNFKNLGYTDKTFIDKFAYAYTTERTNDGFFWAIIYRIKKTKQGEHWKVVRKRHRRQRQKACAVAYKWYCERRELLKKRLTLQGKLKIETDEEWKQQIESSNKQEAYEK